MEKRAFNPWKWQDERGYVQAVEVKQTEGTLYCAGQAAVNPDGTSSNADMKSQLIHALENLEQVITEAGYECKNIVRLNVYTTSSEELFDTGFDIYLDWVKKHGIKTALTLMEVKVLFETLKIEFEATVVK
ncbi:RidA family protein [Sinomicrobium pectinilyticum]|uniref:RidA family protein n=1 Tax=Sinomicrobium pectinilyticum TaxID=1084421 RepID=A0A3N0E9C4_SINP1|nr:RidA family protein [Sinomicrobium pectinilyticum]RNL84474.1 RidA family protein [Sinomicrobium pectinilyticum]